jgi:hypothetical protein
MADCIWKRMTRAFTISASFEKIQKGKWHLHMLCALTRRKSMTGHSRILLLPSGRWLGLFLPVEELKNNAKHAFFFKLWTGTSKQIQQLRFHGS